MTRDTVSTDKIATPVGPFSPAVRAGEFVYVSGQVAQDPTTGRLVEGDATAQTERIFANLAAVLEAAGKTLDDVVKASVFLTDMRDYPAMNAAYQQRFSAPYPARTAIAVSALPLGAAVEIDVVAR